MDLRPHEMLENLRAAVYEAGKSVRDDDMTALIAYANRAENAMIVIDDYLSRGGFLHIPDWNNPPEISSE